MRNRTIHIRGASLKILVGFLYLMLTTQCISPYEVNIDNESSLLVVHSILTDEMKRQEITLSRSFPFSIDIVPKESNALVYVETDQGTRYDFIEENEGSYLSQEVFRAEKGKIYTLFIKTKDGKNYSSEPKQLVGGVTIDALDIVPKENNQNEKGLSFELTSHGDNPEGSFYRIAFEETYKIVAPYFSTFDAVVFAEGRRMFDLRLILRETEEKTCYGTYKPSKIDIVNSSLFIEDRLNHYPVRFLKQFDPRGMHRYSILVKQYHIDKQTLAYYETLKNLSDASATVFTESQPGQIAGNISALDNSDEVVLGYFEVSGVDSKRVYVDYTDYYLGENRPPFFYDCITSVPSTDGVQGQRPLLEAIKNDDLIYFSSTDPGDPRGPFYMVVPYCGDCTRIGSNKKPDFWIDSNNE